jgi:hypothetical protein
MSSRLRQGFWLRWLSRCSEGENVYVGRKKEAMFDALRQREKEGVLTDEERPFTDQLLLKFNQEGTEALRSAMSKQAGC